MTRFIRKLNYLLLLTFIPVYQYSITSNLHIQTSQNKMSNRALPIQCLIFCLMRTFFDLASLEPPQSHSVTSPLSLPLTVIET